MLYCLIDKMLKNAEIVKCWCKNALLQIFSNIIGLHLLQPTCPYVIIIGFLHNTRSLAAMSMCIWSIYLCHSLLQNLYKLWTLYTNKYTRRWKCRPRCTLLVRTKMWVPKCFFAQEKEEINSSTKQTNDINRFQNYTSL